MFQGIVTIFLYLLISIFSYYIISIEYKKYIRSNYLRAKVSLISIIIVSLMFTILNWFCTVILSQKVLGSDRFNYSVEFTGVRSVQSSGLQFVFDCVKSVGGDIYFVFYITTFITVFITIIAYRRSRLATPRLLLLLFTSEYIFFTFTGLKQSFTVAFCCLFFVNALENKSKKGTILCIIDMILAILFHSSGYILIPLFFILRGKRDNPKRFYLICIISMLCVIFLPNIMHFISSRMGSYAPILSLKIDKYFNTAEVVLDSQWLAVIKYFPFVYVSLWGCINRKRLKNIIEKYDSLLVISIIASAIVLYSLFSYWFQRFRFVFYLPVLLLYELIDKEERLTGNRIVNNSIIYGGTAFVTLRKILLIYRNFGAF